MWSKKRIWNWCTGALLIVTDGKGASSDIVQMSSEVKFVNCKSYGNNVCFDRSLHDCSSFIHQTCLIFSRYFSEKWPMKRLPRENRFPKKKWILSSLEQVRIINQHEEQVRIMNKYEEQVRIINKYEEQVRSLLFRISLWVHSDAQDFQGLAPCPPIVHWKWFCLANVTIWPGTNVMPSYGQVPPLCPQNMSKFMRDWVSVSHLKAFL